MDTAYYLNLAFNGLVEGSIYALGALAITLVFGIARFPNASTGDLMTVGAFGGLAGTLAGGGLLGAAIAGVGVSAAVALAFHFLLFFCHGCCQHFSGAGCIKWRTATAYG